MIWSASGTTVAAAVSPLRAQFDTRAVGVFGGVARVVNTGAEGATFTIGDDSVTNTDAIPLAAGQDIVIAYGAGQTYISASSADVRATPGTGRP